MINMVEEESLEFGERKIDEIRNHVIDEIKHKELMSKKYKKTCKYLNLFALFSFNNYWLSSLCSC